ncbi:PREDICTED: actin cytoskeleton-regulatory complex protein pan-1-like [Lepidothrix coronata]|uniref:Actin cytoskeleton-regulatory complex protein pan-1-like n=1 Tax=Lepidothrix coronata TaxID=321398 RepID=A0A6J0J7K6_9PASS|nr:PREDICTED: actin cytoskeleton-regulatory complex protein pan-1-like [Lepidothrix coronata]
MCAGSRAGTPSNPGRAGVPVARRDIPNPGSREAAAKGRAAPKTASGPTAGRVPFTVARPRGGAGVVPGDARGGPTAGAGLFPPQRSGSGSSEAAAAAASGGTYRHRRLRSARPPRPPPERGGPSARRGVARPSVPPFPRLIDPSRPPPPWPPRPPPAAAPAPSAGAEPGSLPGAAPASPPRCEDPRSRPPRSSFPPPGRGRLPGGGGRKPGRGAPAPRATPRWLEAAGAGAGGCADRPRRDGTGRLGSDSPGPAAPPQSLAGRAGGQGRRFPGAGLFR